MEALGPWVFCPPAGRSGVLTIGSCGNDFIYLPVDHLHEIVDPRRPTEPLLLVLSGSLVVMGAHREDETEAEDDKRVVLLRSVTQAGASVDGGKPMRETLTLGLGR